MLSVIDSMNASEGFSRPMREGEELFRSGMIVSVGKKGKEKDTVHVQSLVLRTSGLSSKTPAIVELWVDMSKAYGQRVVKDNETEFRQHCDCPAGNSEKCKHIISVMLCLASMEEDELEDLNCTDLEQQWGSLKKTTLREYEAKPLSDLCHVAGQRDAYVNAIPDVTREMEESWRNKLMNSVPLSEISIFTSCLRRGQGLVIEEDIASLEEEKKILLKKLLTFRTWQVLSTVRQWTAEKLENLDPDLKDFYYEFVLTTFEESHNILCSEQGSPIWKRARSLRQTASKARAQFTYYVNKKADWDHRYQELFHSTFSGNADTNRGLVDEVECRDRYEEKSLCKVLESGLLIRPELPWLSCSLDGTVLDERGNLVKNVEIKSFKEGTRLSVDELVTMNTMPTLDNNSNVKEKTQHYAQMQLGMLLSGMQECEYLVYSKVSDDYLVITVHFDKKHVLELCSRLVHVYFDEFLPRMRADFNPSAFSVSDPASDESNHVSGESDND